MKASEIRQKSENEIKDILKNLQKELADLNKDLFQQKEKNVKKAVILRKNIARVKTVAIEKIILKGVTHE